MKRIGNIRDRIVSLDNGVVAVIQGTRHKRKKRETKELLYSGRMLEEAPHLYNQVDPEKARRYVEPMIREMKEETYRHSLPKHRRQFCRSSSGGKWRDLYIPTLRDHIMHHMLIQACEKAFTKGMHPHCCGSVPGRGIKHVAHWVQYWMQEDKECRYFVKLDIRKFLPEY